MRTSIIGFILILLCGITIAYFMITDNKQLEIYNPVKIDEKLVDSKLHSIMSGHRIGHFNLINQYGKTITEKDFENTIYVADFFFTTCPGICLAMAKQMVRVQEANKDALDFKILSHTVQPEVDSPAVLLEYAEFYDANPEIWQFATGDRMEIFNLARKSYFAATLEKGGDEGDMVHTENFVLVDKEKRIRGIYDGTSVEEVDKLIEDIEILRKSYE
jgi:protein SCO1/2